MVKSNPTVPREPSSQGALSVMSAQQVARSRMLTAYSRLATMVQANMVRERPSVLRRCQFLNIWDTRDAR